MTVKEWKDDFLEVSDEYKRALLAWKSAIRVARELDEITN